jgi:hypothetical protein
MFVKRILLAGSVLIFTTAIPALAQKKHGPGATDTEIKIGHYAVQRARVGLRTIGKAWRDFG